MMNILPAALARGGQRECELHLHCEDNEAHHLDRLAAHLIHKGHREPISRDSASQRDNQVPEGGVVEKLVDVGVLLGRVPNRAENGGCI